MSVIQEQFLRRYATSPIHVPRLERLMAAYGATESDDAFVSSYIEWDRAAGDSDAARIVAEILPLLVDDQGAIVRLTDQAVRGSIAWLSQRGTIPLNERSYLLRTILEEAVGSSR